MGFQNKTAVITGGALGIGRCLTRAFADAGCRIAFFFAAQGLERKTLIFFNEWEKTLYFSAGMGKPQKRWKRLFRKQLIHMVILII